jgi:hypothetical protein
VTVGGAFGLTLAGLGGLAKSANLSDVASAATALSNLGGAAKSANLSDLANAATARTNLGVPSTTAVAGAIASAGALSAGYYFTSSPNSATTGTFAAAGQLRLVPFVVPNALTVTSIGLEVTTAGDAGSLVRLGIFADTAGAPSTLLLDAGTVAGDVVQVAELACSLALSAGVCWIGAVAQNWTTTSPTLRWGSNPAPVPVRVGTTTPVAGATVAGLGCAGVTGALASSPAGPAAIGGAPRVFVKVA